MEPTLDFIEVLPPELKKNMGSLINWFQVTVNRLEGAYGELGQRFEAVSKELESKNKELKSMQRQVEHSKTLAALGQMAATVAHEIRNPLAGIGGFAGLLERDLEEGDPRRILVRKIVGGVSSLNKIVSNLLVYTRPMELQLQKIPIVEWVEDVLRFAELEIESQKKPIRIERKFNAKGVIWRLDPEKFQQVLLNLLLNAIQAIKKEGCIQVLVDQPSAETLILCVEDNGVGLSKEDLDKIFNPFFTTKEQGTGLGLAIVQRIVELHGGKIFASPLLTGGAKFNIQLENQEG